MHDKLNLSTKDTVRGSKNYMPYIVLVHLEHLKEDNLSIKDKTAEFILSPTCPLFGGSTLCIINYYDIVHCMAVCLIHYLY